MFSRLGVFGGLFVYNGFIVIETHSESRTNLYFVFKREIKKEN